MLNKAYSTTRLLQPSIESKPEDKFKSVLFLSNGKDRQGEGGLRTRGHFKASLEGKPLITVVTVIFNGEKFLEETIPPVSG